MIGSMAALNLLLSAGLSVSGNKMQFYSKKKCIAILKLKVDGL